MDREKALASIIVPMHNAEDYICETLASILSESEIPIEIIVVNDESTDASLNQVLNFSDRRIRVIEGPGRGAAAAMNAGFAEARGEIVMHCDADDLYPEGRIRRQVAWLIANPEYAAVCGSFSTIDSKGRPISDLPCAGESAEITEELRNGVVRTSLGTYAIRRVLLDRVGEFREYFESSYDIDMQLRFSEVGRIAYVPDIFYVWRVHASSITHQQSNVVMEFFEQTALDFQLQRRISGSDDLQRGSPRSKPKDEPSVAVSANAHIQAILLGRAWREHAGGQKAKALATGLRAFAANPSDFTLLRSLVALAFKRAGGKRD